MKKQILKSIEIKLRQKGFVVPKNVPTLTMDGERKTGIEVLNSDKTVEELAQFIADFINPNN